MSYEFLRAAWRDKKTKGNVRLALLSLADQANDDGICWPSKQNLNRRINCAKRTADEAVLDLLRAGLVEGYSGTKRNGRNTSNHYIMKAWMTEHQYEKAIEKVKDILGDSMVRIEPSPKKERKMTEDDKSRMGADRCTPMVQTVAPDHPIDHPIDHKENTHPSGSNEPEGSELLSDGGEQTEESTAMRTEELRPADEPFGVYQRLAQIDASITGRRGQALRDAKAMLNGSKRRGIEKYTPDDILGCAEFIQQDPFVIAKMIPLTTDRILQKLPKWIENGRPESWSEWQRKAKAGIVSSAHVDRTREMVTEAKFG